MPTKIEPKSKLKQLFCKHNYVTGRPQTTFFNLSGDRYIEVCTKCGKIKREYFMPNADGS